MSTQAALGQKALENRDYVAAVEQFTKALATNTSSPSPLWLIQRSTAHHRLNDFEAALADADAAVLAAKDRGRRELIATAQYRRAIALHGLKRFGDSRLCLTWCRKVNEKEPGLGMWQAKVKADFEKVEQEHGPEAAELKTSVKENPDKAAISVGSKVEGKQKSIAEPAPLSAPVASAAVSTPKDKIRHEWFQSSTTVTITVFAKGIPQDKADIDIEENSLDISFPLNGIESSFGLTFLPLFSKIKPAESSFKIFSTKLEIILAKATPGLKWVSLEGKAEPVGLDSTPAADSKVEKTEPEKAASQPAVKTTASAPVYPTSSRSGPKNWDNPDLYQDEEDSEDVNSFFQKLYKGSDENTRRAMMKSMQESNGTSLSTNWSEVSKGPVEVHPPEGVEAKKWNS